MGRQADPGLAAILQKVEKGGHGRVKVGVFDIDGILRGKCMHAGKLGPALERGFGFNVFGTDVSDRPYDLSHISGRRLGFPDAHVRLDPATFRTVPWDGDVPFLLGEFVKGDGAPHPLCPRQLLRRVLDRASALGYRVMVGTEYEFVNFRETPESWASKNGSGPRPITQGMSAYSLTRANANRDYFNALMEETARFGVPLEGLHTETGPGVYEAAILYDEGLEAADRAALFKDAAKEIGARFGIMPSFMAKWSSKYPGCSGHVHQSLVQGDANAFHDPAQPRGMSKVFRSYLQGQVSFLMEFAPMFWPTVNSYKRLVRGFWAPVRGTWGVDNRTAMFRVLLGEAGSTRVETRCPGADTNPYLSIAACIAAGLAGVEQGLPLVARPTVGDDDRDADGIPAPRTLIETTRAFHASRLAREWFGAEFVDYYAATREAEWRQWLDAVTDWELRRYFEVI